MPPQAETPPEVADGGYWYAVAAIVDEDGNISPGDIPGPYCAWYREIDGVLYAAVRTPDPVIGVATVDMPIADIVAEWGQKPYGRAGGR